MKKFAPLFIATAALASLQGCATEASTSAEMTAEDQAAVCANPEGTNAAIAALAAAITKELHRWNITTDFYVYNGYQNQQMLGLTSAGLAACGGTGCPATANLLLFQDSRNTNKLIINGTKVDSWNFASRVVTGYGNQKSCEQNKQCPYPTHVFGWLPDNTYNGFSSAPGACDTLFTFNVNRPTAQNHAKLTAAESNQLINALRWTTGNGPNPYIAFQSTASTVTIDPGGNMVPPPAAAGLEICQQFSNTTLNGQPCTCAATGIYANGALKNDQTLTPKTYFCRQMAAPPPPPATGGTAGVGGAGGSGSAPAAGTGGSQ